MYVYEWTLTAVKFLQSFDKQDRTDLVQSLFFRDRDGRFSEAMLRVRGITLERENDGSEEVARALEELPIAQQHQIDEFIPKDNGVKEDDHPVLSICLNMTQTEFDLLLELLRVFDQARSHFVYEICEPSVKRFLNATRIRFEEEQDGRMPWSEYKTTLLERMQNTSSSAIDGPRENGCPIGLWVAERVAERKLSTRTELTCPRIPGSNSRCPSSKMRRNRLSRFPLETAEAT